MDELSSYISSALKSGMSRESISQQLIAQGWTSEQVNNALSTAMPPPELTAGKDTLGWVVSASILLLFVAINIIWLILSH